MKRFSLLCVLAVALCAVATANIIPTWTSTTPSGPNFIWSYQPQLSADQDAFSGNAPAGNPVLHTETTTASFFTIYDFAGYVAASCTGPAGWACVAQNVGFTPDNVSPTDSPNIVNITWYRTGATIGGQPSGVDLSATAPFTATSIYSLATLVSYTSRGMANAGPQTGKISDNVGETQGPNGVPEPATMGLIGAGLVGLGLLRRKAHKS